MTKSVRPSIRQEPRKEYSPTRGLGSGLVSLVPYLGDAPGVVGTWKNLFGKFMFWPKCVAPVVMRIRKSSRSTESLSWKHESPPTRIPSQRLQMMEPKLKPDSWHWSSCNKIDLFQKLDPNVQLHMIKVFRAWVKIKWPLLSIHAFIAFPYKRQYLKPLK